MGPSEGEKAFRLHFLDQPFPNDMFVARPGDLASGDLAGDEWAVQLYAKPLAEFAVVGQGAPDAGDGRVEFNAFLDAVGHFMQPPGCILAKGAPTCNLGVALYSIKQG